MRLSSALVFCALLPAIFGQSPPDAIVVGAGIAGLCATYELAKGGASVVVVDAASVFGGHAVMATGDLCIAGTPEEEAAGRVDSPELLYRDLMAWGEDADPAWARYYADHVKPDVYDWLKRMGLSFGFTAAKLPGNSVHRTHRVQGRGLALVTPIYAACASHPNVRFEWNVAIKQLLVEAGSVTGIAGTNLRSGNPLELRSRIVVLATGGFQANLELVKENWPSTLPKPDRILIGAGVNALGSGLSLARDIGAKIDRLDHQWNYITGIPDPRAPGSMRGLNVQHRYALWVNAAGRRFIAEQTSTKHAMEATLRQPGQTYWAIFDEAVKKEIFVAGSSWGAFSEVEKWILNNGTLTKRGRSVKELALDAGLPVETLEATVARHNAMVEKGDDVDFGRFGPDKPLRDPRKISTPPYYAIQFYQLTRKSMGGVAIDRDCRVLNTEGAAIPGFYAAGEVTGLAGINGRAGLEGTFLGPSILTGRVAGQRALAQLGKSSDSRAMLPVKESKHSPDPLASTELCMKCHDLPKLTQASRPSYWHFEKAHKEVLSAKMECVTCHSDMTVTFDPVLHRRNPLAQLKACAVCHKGEDR